MNFVSVNGIFKPSNEPVLQISNRAYRYGDGLFETMKLVKGGIPLAKLHFERLFHGLALMKYDIPASFTPARLSGEMQALAEMNNCMDLSRIRLSVYRGNGDLHGNDKALAYTIECSEVAEHMNRFNEQGLEIGIYPDARKQTGPYNNLKSANFHPYSLAAIFAKEQQWDDCLVLNDQGHIADATIANVFVIIDETISTPALGEGCVNGVMRKYLLEEMKAAGYLVIETKLAPETLENAQACFLTNAFRGIYWVKKCGSKEFGGGKVHALYERFISPLFTK